jgi:DNA-binding CsgD family transcriptional regulator
MASGPERKLILKRLKADGLTPSEIQIADLVIQGKSNFEIYCDIIKLEKTIKWHLTNVYRKLGLKSRAQLMHKYLTPLPIEKAEEPCSLTDNEMENHQTVI